MSHRQIPYANFLDAKKLDSQACNIYALLAISFQAIFVIIWQLDSRFRFKSRARHAWKSRMMSLHSGWCLGWRGTVHTNPFSASKLWKHFKSFKIGSSLFIFTTKARKGDRERMGSMVLALTKSVASYSGSSWQLKVLVLMNTRKPKYPVNSFLEQEWEPEQQAQLTNDTESESNWWSEILPSQIMFSR